MSTGNCLVQNVASNDKLLLWRSTHFVNFFLNLLENPGNLDPTPRT
jgi:hypothetical protein